ncbi:MAG: CDP-alcohol phosphatidyltransferase family protein [Candidatus Paceibacterota bacterium]|jgi:CDP-diacylglycerol--glycerol-3-phosphate 3-phosphatidyltransferase
MNNLTVTDKILRQTLLLIIPKWVTPNIVTWFRFATIPFVIYLFVQESYVYGLILFAISAFSDAVDGSLARTRNQVSDWGKMYDPFADKLLIGAAALILVSRFLNIYLAGTIVGIEFFLIVSAFYRKRFQGKPIEAEFSGKIKMVLQSLAVVSILIAASFQLPAFLTIAAYLLYLAVIFAIISLVVYKSI